MAIASRFRQELVIHRLDPGSDEDARGNRADSWEADEAIPGNLQRRASREIAAGDLRGVGVSDAIAFLPISTEPPGPADYIVEGESVYEIVGPVRDAGARGRHLEADLLLVVP